VRERLVELEIFLRAQLDRLLRIAIAVLRGRLPRGSGLIAVYRRIVRLIDRICGFCHLQFGATDRVRSRGRATAAAPKRALRDLPEFLGYSLIEVRGQGCGRGGGGSDRATEYVVITRAQVNF